MAHLEKFTLPQAAHMIRHNVRDKNPDGSYISFGRSAVDPARTPLNYRLGPSGNPHDRLRARLAECKTQKRADLKVMLSWIVTRPLDGSVSDEETPRFFQATYNHLASLYGEKNVVIAAVHLDETTPHLHFCFIPAVQDKRHPEREKVCAKELTTPRHMRAFHGELRKAVVRELGHAVGLVADELMPGADRKAAAPRKALPLEVLKAQARKEEGRAKAAEVRRNSANEAAAAAEARRDEAIGKSVAALRAAQGAERQREKAQSQVRVARKELKELDPKIKAAEHAEARRDRAIQTAREVKEELKTFQDGLTEAKKHIKAAEGTAARAQKALTAVIKLAAPLFTLAGDIHEAATALKAKIEDAKATIKAAAAAKKELDELTPKLTEAQKTLNDLRSVRQPWTPPPDAIRYPQPSLFESKQAYADRCLKAFYEALDQEMRALKAKATDRDRAVSELKERNWQWERVKEAEPKIQACDLLRRAFGQDWWSRTIAQAVDIDRETKTQKTRITKKARSGPER